MTSPLSPHPRTRRLCIIVSLRRRESRSSSTTPTICRRDSCRRRRRRFSAASTGTGSRREGGLGRPEIRGNRLHRPTGWEDGTLGPTTYLRPIESKSVFKTILSHQEVMFFFLETSKTTPIALAKLAIFCTTTSKH